MSILHYSLPTNDAPIPEARYAETFASFRSALSTVVGAQHELKQFLKDGLEREHALNPRLLVSLEIQDAVLKKAARKTERRAHGIPRVLALDEMQLAHKASGGMLDFFKQIEAVTKTSTFTAVKHNMDKGQSLDQALNRYIRKHGGRLEPSERQEMRDYLTMALQGQRLSQEHSGFVEKFHRDLTRLRADKGFCEFVKQGVKTALERE